MDTTEIKAAIAALSTEDRAKLIAELTAKPARVRTNAGVLYKVGDSVTVLATADVPKKWLGKTLVITNIGTDRYYLDNPDHPGVKHKSVWPLFSDVTSAV